MHYTIAFEDHGQAFLEWEVKDGVVITCRPWRAWEWQGTRVDMRRAQEGRLLPIIAASGAAEVVYPVATMWRTEG